MSDNDQLGQLPDPFETERYFAGPHDRTFDLYTSDQMRAYAEQAVAAERERWQKWTCRKEWDSVNDPPCHPSDKGWRPCSACAGPNAAHPPPPATDQAPPS